MAKKKTAKMSKRKKIGAGVGAAAAVAAVAAGYYFYVSKDARKHRKQAAKWAADMKKDVVAQAKKLKKLSKKDVDRIIASAATTYQRARNVDKEKIKQAAQELKDNWDMLEKEIRKATTARGTAKRKTPTAKKPMKKTTAKKTTNKKK